MCIATPLHVMLEIGECFDIVKLGFSGGKGGQGKTSTLWSWTYHHHSPYCWLRLGALEKKVEALEMNNVRRAAAFSSPFILPLPHLIFLL